MKKFVLIFILTISIIASSFAQNVGITNDGSLPHASAMLDVKHPNKGMLVPRVALTGTTDAVTITSPVTSLLVYNTATIADVTPGYYYWSSIAWLRLTTGLPSAPAWLLTGNAGTNPATNFVGTTDNQPLVFRQNSKLLGKWNTATGNYFIGAGAGASTSSGVGNSVIGDSAGYAGTDAFLNVLIGSNAGKKNTGHWNTIVGESAGMNNQSSGNVFVGSKAGMLNTTGSNTFVGDNAGRENTTGFTNSFFGSYAGQKTTASDNTFLGALSGFNNTAGSWNTASGSYALFANTTGTSNTATGHRAMNDNTTGIDNTSQGFYALLSNSTGHRNTGIGTYALRNSVSGNNNTAIGFKALDQLATGTKNIAIGYNSGTDPGSPNVTNTISIGNDGILNAASNQAFLGNLSTLWNGGNKPWSTYSDARMKNNIKEDVKGLDFITRLKPVTYYRSINEVTKIINSSSPASQSAGHASKPIIAEYAGKYDVEKIKETGFLAQDVEQAAKAAGFDFSGITIPRSSNQLYTLSYEVFVVPLVKAVQEQQVMIDQQKLDNEALKAQVAELTKLVTALLEK